MIRVGSSSGGGSTRTTTTSTVLLVRGREKERMERKGSALIVSPSLIARWARLTRCTLSPETDRRTNQFPLVYLTFLFPHLTALDYSSRPLTSSLSLPGKTSIIHTDRPPWIGFARPCFSSLIKCCNRKRLTTILPPICPKVMESIWRRKRSSICAASSVFFLVSQSELACAIKSRNIFFLLILFIQSY